MQRTSVRQKISLIIFGIFLTFILLEVGLRLGGFILTSLQEYRNRISMQQKGAYRILCLGESTTVLGGKDSYPSQLEEILNQKYTHVKFSVINKGITGVTTSDILLKLEQNLDKHQPDMIVAMMGINDSIEALIDINDAKGQTVFRPKKQPFFKSLRTYKLVNLLNQHIRRKISEILSYNSTKETYVSLTSDKKSVSAYTDSETKEIDEELMIINAADPYNYYKLGDSYKDQGRYEEAEAMFEKFIKIFPESYNKHIDIGWHYKLHGKYKKAEELFKKAIRINPSNSAAYIGLGWTYCHWWDREGNLSMAEEMFKKAIELNPNDLDAYIESAAFYREPGRQDISEKLLKKALEIAPEDIDVYMSLAQIYTDQGKYDLAETMFKKAQTIDPEAHGIYINLLQNYIAQRDFSKAKIIFEKAVEMNIADEDFYRNIALCYEIQKKYNLARKYFEESDRLRMMGYNAMTYYSYQKFRDIVMQRRLKLVVMQYPVRSAAPLKALFSNAEGIIFVDNERVFKEAIAKKGYDALFTDQFGGDFGHCTRKGNRLLANNIAKAILSELGLLEKSLKD